MAVTSPFFFPTASSLSEPEPASPSVIFCLLPHRTRRLRPGNLLHPNTFVGFIPMEDLPEKETLLSEKGSRGSSGLSKTLPRKYSLGQWYRATRYEAGEDHGWKKMRRRRGRLLLILRRLLFLLSRLLYRLLRCCFLRCHEYLTPFQFQKWSYRM